MSRSSRLPSAGVQISLFLLLTLLPAAVRGANACLAEGTGVIRACVSSDSNAGFLLNLNGTPQWSVATVSGGDFQVFDETGQVNRLYIDTATGGVGLGTAEPESDLHISGGNFADLLLESSQGSSVSFRSGDGGPVAPVWWAIFSNSLGELSFFRRPDLPCTGSCPPALQFLQNGRLRLGSILEGDLQLDGELRCLVQGIGGRPQPGCIGTAAIGDLVVTRAKLALDAIDASRLADGAVGTAEIQANAVDSSKIKDGSVGTAEVDANQIQLRAKPCPAGRAIRGIALDGTPVCETLACFPGAGTGSIVCRGGLNSATGANSFAAGSAASAGHAGAFVWADGNKLASSAANEFSVRASGGARFLSSSKNVGVRLAPGGNSWSSLSDRDLKENFTPVNGREVLERLARVPVNRWNLKSQTPDIHHIGPTAQDFFSAFGLGESDRYISGSDADGVTLVSVQALYRMTLDLEQKTREIAEKTEQIAEMNRRLNALERSVAALQAER